MLKHSCPSTGRDGSDIGKSQKATPKHMLLRRKSTTSVEKSGQSAKLLCLLPLLAADTTCYVGAAASEHYGPSEVMIRQGPKRCSPVPHASVTVTALLLGSFLHLCTATLQIYGSLGEHWKANYAGLQARVPLA